MALQLPRRGVRGSGRQTVSLPGTENVQQVGIQRDPGLSVPQGAFGPELGDTGIDEAFDKFAEVQRKQLARDSAVSRAKARSEFAGWATEELRRIETEEDLSDEQVLNAFAKSLGQKKDEVLGAHQGDADSMARLETTLESIRFSIADSAAIKAVGARQAALANVFKEDLNSITASAFDNPGELSGAFDLLDERIDDMAPGLTPDQEMQFRADGRKAITRSAVDGFMLRGDVESAQDLYYGLAGVRETLGPEEQRQYETRFASYRQQQNAAANAAREKLVQFEIINGRPPNAAERLQISGIKPRTGPQSFTEKVADLENSLGRPLTQDELTKYAGIDAGNPYTDAGKHLADRARFVDVYGEGSEQVKAFDEMSKPQPEVSDESTMRKEFTSLSKDFIQLRDAYNKIEAGASDATGASDMSLIFSYMKILDPGSTVREGEFASAEKATGVPARILNLYNKTVDGTFLTPEQRKQFVGQAGKLMAAQLKSQIELEDRYKSIAKDSGLSPDRVVVNFVGDLRELAEKKDETPVQKFDLQGNATGPTIAVPAGLKQLDEGEVPTDVPASEMSDEELQAEAIRQLEDMLNKLKGNASE